MRYKWNLAARCIALLGIDPDRGWDSSPCAVPSDMDEPGFAKSHTD